MDPFALVLALAPVIAVLAYVGGVTRGRRGHRVALAVTAAISLLWLAFVLALGLSSS